MSERLGRWADHLAVYGGREVSGPLGFRLWLEYADATRLYAWIVSPGEYASDRVVADLPVMLKPVSDTRLGFVDSFMPALEYDVDTGELVEAVD